MKIEICASDPIWTEIFHQEKGHLTNIMAPTETIIEHVGSTAVIGLLSKPIVDVMLGVENLVVINQHIEPLEHAGYTYQPEFERLIPERRFLSMKAGKWPYRINLHAVQAYGEFWVDHILFRDYLKEYHEVSAIYGELKKRLATQFPNDRPAYGKAKTDFIMSVLARCRTDNSEHKRDSSIWGPSQQKQ